VQIIRPRILCVDDETIGARIRGEILSEHGYSVVLYDCPLAVLHCDLSMFDPAILDFQMPGIKWPRTISTHASDRCQISNRLAHGCLETLSDEAVRLFARCIDKGMPIHYLLDTIAEFLEPNQVPDDDS